MKRFIVASAGLLALSAILTTVSAQKARTACAVFDDSGNVYFDGLLNIPLGGSRLDVVNCQLIVDGIGSSGADGVIQPALFSKYMVTRLATPNFSLSAFNTQAEIRQVGVVDGVGGQEISMTRIINTGNDTIQLSMDCAKVDVQMFTIELYDGSGTLVIATPMSAIPPILEFPKVDIQGMACALVSDTSLYTTVRLGEERPIMIRVEMGYIGPYTAKCFKMTGFSPIRIPEVQEAIENRFRNTGPVTMISFYAGPLTPDQLCP